MQRKAVLGMMAVSACALVTVAAQEIRPGNVPFYTWVREDTFAGFIDNDMARFERGVKKAEEYLSGTASRTDAENWIGATKVYRAVRAFREGDTGAGETLLREAFAEMDRAAASQPDNVGVRATAGGTLAYFASQLPERHGQAAMEKAREHYAALWKAQSPVLAHLPLHIKGELLAGVAETEFRAGDRERAMAMLNTIVKELRGSGYAKTAEAWLAAPDKVTREERLVCKSCHEPGRLQAWIGRQQKGD
jgi:hypothetical protein